MKKFIFSILAASVILSGCNKTESTNRAAGPGRLSVSITDDPFDISFVESATVTITKIEVRKSGDNTENPFVVLSETPVTVNLIDLRNGVTEELINLEVADGDYDLVRLYVDETSLKIKDQPEPYRLKVPSGKQTGIKVFISPAIHVEGGLTAELLLDFDLSKSFVMRGNMHHSAGVNGFIFKPCIRAINKTIAGRVEGFVRDTVSVPIADAKVWVKQDTVIATAFADPDGHYALIALPSGVYTVFATQTGYDTVSAEGIVVVPGNRVNHDFTLRNPLYFVSSEIESATPDKLVMTYSSTLAKIVPDVSAFTVSVNSAAVTINAVSIDGNKVILTLASPVAPGDAVTLAYTKPDTNPLQTGEGYEAASFTAQDVTNNVAK